LPKPEKTIAQSWPASHVEVRELSTLKADARNSRNHSPKQIDQIGASMREWGWTNPILVDEAGTIIAGHGRVLAALKIGFTEGPVMVARGWTEEQKQAYLIADNKLALNATWDVEKLAVSVNDLMGKGFDTSLTGFTAQEVEDMAVYSKAKGVKEIHTTQVHDRFWISLRGDLAGQAQALTAIKALADAMPGLEIDMGVISLEP
jgi:hypothetical protein